MTIGQNIKSLVNSRDWAGLDRYLSLMSNSEMKRAERVVRESVLPYLDNTLFWETYEHLVEFRHQAFLSGIMSVGRLASRQELSYDCDGARSLAAYISGNVPTAASKILRMLLPLLHTEQQITGAFHLFGINDEKVWIHQLLTIQSPLSYYVMFHSLMRLDDPLLAKSCYTAIVKQNTDMAYNLASIIRSYFGLEDVKSLLSLRIEPWELSHITKSYDNFLRVLHGKRPVV